MKKVDKRWKRIKKMIDNRQKDLVLVLEDIYDPHNAAAILRSADAFGVPEVYFIFKNTKYYNPYKVGKSSSSSANKWLGINIFYSTKECLNYLRKRHYKIVATVLDDEALNFWEADFVSWKKIAILVGNEHSGLSSEALNLSHKKIYIPMRGMVQSLNVSVSAALFLAEITRQRRNSSLDFSLSENQKRKFFKIFKDK